jgi:dTDP-4-amino-4,6-dideoxygalactose transaminase
MKKRFLGGELFFSPASIFQQKKFDLALYLRKRYPGKAFIYTGGGYYSLIHILKNSGFKENDRVLLPSYLCLSVLLPFQKLGLRYDFYQIDSSLEIDLHSLEKKLDNDIRLILFINYFGFPHSAEVLQFLNNLRGPIILEDCVHSFFSSFENIGDYLMNSFRKFLPFDGSVIVASRPIDKKVRGTYLKYRLLKVGGQLLRYAYFVLGMDTKKLFLKLLTLSEKRYYEYASVSFPIFSKMMIQKMDIPKMIRQRRTGYQRLLSRFKEIAIFKQLPDNVVPLGFPVQIEQRDAVRKELIKKNIFCPIHWVLPEGFRSQGYSRSNAISSRIITIPLSQEITEDHLFILEKALGGISS